MEPSMSLYSLVGASYRNVTSSLWASARRRSSLPDVQKAKPTARSNTANTKYPTTALMTTSSRKFTEIRNRQLQHEPDRPQSRRDPGKRTELRLLRAVLLDLDLAGRTLVNLVNRFDDVFF